MRKAILAVILSGLFGAMQAGAQGQDFSKVEMKVQKVAGTVYMLEGAGGNIAASVGDDGIVMVDESGTTAAFDQWEVNFQTRPLDARPHW